MSISRAAGRVHPAFSTRACPGGDNATRFSPTPPLVCLSLAHSFLGPEVSFPPLSQTRRVHHHILIKVSPGSTVFLFMNGGHKVLSGRGDAPAASQTDLRLYDQSQARRRIFPPWCPGSSFTSSLVLAPEHGRADRPPAAALRWPVVPRGRGSLQGTLHPAPGPGPCRPQQGVAGRLRDMLGCSRAWAGGPWVPKGSKQVPDGSCRRVGLGSGPGSPVLPLRALPSPPLPC